MNPNMYICVFRPPTRKTINRFIKKRHALWGSLSYKPAFFIPEKSRLCENSGEDKNRDNHLRFQAFYMNEYPDAYGRSLSD